MNFLAKLVAVSFVGTTVVTGSPANASILWEQTPAPENTPENSGIANQIVPDFGSGILATINDVAFNSDVRIDRVTTFNIANTEIPTGSDATTAVLNIFDSDPLADTDDPFTGGDFGIASVLVDVITTSSGLNVVADGLGIELQAGTYWFGLTPSFSFSEFSQIFQHKSSLLGDAAQFRDPTNVVNGGFTDWTSVASVVGPPRDTALRVEGVSISVPAPASLLLLLSALGMLAMIYRRNSKQLKLG